MGMHCGEVQGLGVRAKGFVSTAYFLCVLSVPVPFRGDYIGLRGNPKLQKLTGGEEGPVLMAETVRKVNRGNGKVKPRPECRPTAGRVGADPISLTLSRSVPRLPLEFYS